MKKMKITSYAYIADKDGNIIAPSDFGWGEEE